MRRGSPTAEAKRQARDDLKRIANKLNKRLPDEATPGMNIVELDIMRCRAVAQFGLAWAHERDAIKHSCEILGWDENQWTRKHLGRAIVTLQGYRHLGREWPRYVVKRREIGDCGVTGVAFALSLVPMMRGNGNGTNSRKSRDHSETLDITRISFITDDAASALRKMDAESVDVMPNSPPYYPLKRIYGGSFGGQAVGREPTVEKYIEHLVQIYREARRVLHRRGTLIVLMKDSYSSAKGGKYQPNTHLKKRAHPQKQRMPDGTPIQAGDRPNGNLLMIPSRFALAMQDDGWILRMMLPIRIKGHPESVKDRTTLDYEWLLVFTKQVSYYWNNDAIREPLAETARPARRRGRGRKDGVLRRDNRRDLRVVPNPMGRNSSSVLEFNASNYRGKHPATISENLAEWILKATCDDSARVCDPFGGVATFAIVAAQMGFTATSIDIYDDYTKEAIERATSAPATRPVERTDNGK